MSIFRVEKNTNYTVISNYHLRDRRLSLKTIGLLSLILSLPEDWDYSEAGLAAICKDGKDSISSGLKELEKYGYLERERERGEGGRICGMIYRVYEVPKEHQEKSATNSSIRQSPKSGSPLMDQPRMENPSMVDPSVDAPLMDSPITEIPRLELPLTGKQAQINKESLITDIQKINQPIYQPINNTHRNLADGLVDGSIHSDSYARFLKSIRENVNYDFIQFKRHTFDRKLDNGEIVVEEYERSVVDYDIKKVDQVIGYMIDILLSKNDDPIKIGGDLIDRDVVRAKLMKIGMIELKGVVRELNLNPTIKNPKSYAISMLYNA